MDYIWGKKGEDSDNKYWVVVGEDKAQLLWIETSHLSKPEG